MFTPVYAAIFGLMLILLSVNVIRARRQFRAAIGDANNYEVKRRIRAQANFVEYTPLFLILLGYNEFSGIPASVIITIGAVFLLGRIMHAYSLLYHEEYDHDKVVANPVWRIRGMKCTFGMIAILSLMILIKSAVAVFAT